MNGIISSADDFGLFAPPQISSLCGIYAYISLTLSQLPTTALEQSSKLGNINPILISQSKTLSYSRTFAVLCNCTHKNVFIDKAGRFTLLYVLDSYKN